MKIRRTIAWVTGTLVFLGLALLLLLSGRLELVFQTVKTLAVGWAVRAAGLPALTGAQTWTTFLCAIAAGAGLHGIFLGIARHRGKAWRLKWTAALLAAVLLCCGAAIAVTGAVHQAAWLRREKFTDLNRAPAGELRNQRIRAAFDSYARAHSGRLPADLRELQGHGMKPEDFFARGGLPWGYVSGHTVTSARKQVLLYSPHPARRFPDALVVYGEMDKWIGPEELPQAIEQSKRAAFARGMTAVP